MESFFASQNNSMLDNAFSFIGGVADDQNLDTTIGLSSDMGIGQINALFNSSKTNTSTNKSKREVINDQNKQETIEQQSQIIPALFSTKNTNEDNNNNGNNTIWMIVLIVILILLIFGFIVYKLYRNKKVKDQAKKIYSNISGKLSELQNSFKKTTIDTQ